MSSTAHNNPEASSSSTASINSDTSKESINSLEEKLDNLFSLVNRFMKQSMNSGKKSSAPSSKRVDDDSDTEDEDKGERSYTDLVPTDYQLSDTLFGSIQTIYKQPRFTLRGRVPPFGTPEGITASSTIKNSDADLFMVEKRINDTLKPPLLMLTGTTHDVELIRYLAESAIILAVKAQASLDGILCNKISQENNGSEVQSRSMIGQIVIRVDVD
ncbi:hypothetical protein ACTFIU_009041 [Dictyostelium citrinum]